MNFNVNLEPHIQALLFLGAGTLLAALILLTPVLYFWRRQWVRHSLLAIAVVVVGYGALTLAFSAFSHERILAIGEEKYFCELDCHLAYSVQQIRKMKSIGNATADGEFYAVTIRARFDEATTAPWRPRDVPLTPNPRTITLVDDRGQSIAPSAAGQQAWETIHGKSATLLDPLRPGESYEAVRVFDVPSGVSSARLLVSSEGFPVPVLIGHESSLWHKKTYFAL